MTTIEILYLRVLTLSGHLAGPLQGKPFFLMYKNLQPKYFHLVTEVKDAFELMLSIN